MKKIFLIIMGSMLLFSTCDKKSKDKDDVIKGTEAPDYDGFMLSAYFPSYRNLGDISDAQLQAVDIIYYAFAEINQSGKPEIQNATQLSALVSRCRPLGIKVLLSFNGQHSRFAEMVKTRAGRKVFIDELIRMINLYGLDGVDNDWEYPRLADASGANNLQFMKELSTELRKDGKGLLLTMAITAGLWPGDVTGGLPNELFSYLDWANLMAYDNYSTSEPDWHHSDFFVAEGSFGFWHGIKGIPAKKLVIGIPCYGRPSGITQSGTTLAFKDILAQGGSPDKDTATVSSPAYPAPYLIYYNGRPTVVNKTNFAKTKNAAGVMFWEMWHDTPDERSLIKAARTEADK